MGSKNRLAKYLLPIILKDRKPGQWYVEPFCGGCNLIDKVCGPRIANDSNYYLIEMFKGVLDGVVIPDKITENEYKDIRDNKDKYPAWLVGFVGFGCSYGGKWFGGYARWIDKNGIPANYCKQSKTSLLKQIENLSGVLFFNKSYQELVIPDNSIVYCDPPYMGTTKYKDSIDYTQFWNWCDGLVNKGHKVFVSEYNAPSDWGCVWEKEVNNTLVKDTGSKKGIEKLFTKVN